MVSLRRVPWTSRNELGELYELIFSPSSDYASKQRGLARMSVYLSSPSCPAFLPLLHGLLTASLIPPPSNGAEVMTTRMTCAMALVRFVNGMVDPLQTGSYARPISHLAASIALPPMLIAIRHRATHEDLPSLPLLLTSVHMALDYLHHFAFLPLLASSSDLGLATAVSPGRMRAETIVKRWKKVMKLRTGQKIVGEENDSGKELRRVRRDLETVDPEDLVAVLCGTQGLVPVARKKRPSPNVSAPTRASLLIWQPLLDHLTVDNPTFPTLLMEQLVTTLLDADFMPLVPDENQDLSESRKEGESARWCISTWVLWLWSQENASAVKREDKAELARKILSALISGDRILKRLHKCLTAIDNDLSDSSALNDLLITDVPEDELKGLDVEDEEMRDDVEAKVAEMERRLVLLEQGRASKFVARSAVVSDTQGGEQLLPPGWRRTGSEWKECPIGIFASA